MGNPDDPTFMAFAKMIDALPGLLNAESRDALCDWLAERQFLRDGQEDPGAVMVDGLETELALAEAFRKISESLGCGKPV